MVDKYINKIRPLFEFNNKACCARIPKSYETTFHYRNYMTELPDWRAYSMGFSELSVNKTVHELFKGLSFSSNNTTIPTTNKDHIVVTSRIANKYARAYVEAFQKELGISSDLIKNHSGVQDFCFLKETTKELVGNARSTYVFWAAVLGKVSKARLYHVDTFGLRERHPTFWERFTYPWSNPDLKNRIHFELYQSEEVDKKEGIRNSPVKSTPE